MREYDLDAMMVFNDDTALRRGSLASLLMSEIDNLHRYRDDLNDPEKLKARKLKPREKHARHLELERIHAALGHFIEAHKGISNLEQVVSDEAAVLSLIENILRGSYFAALTHALRDTARRRGGQTAGSQQGTAWSAFDTACLGLADTVPPPTSGGCRRGAHTRTIPTATATCPMGVGPLAATPGCIRRDESETYEGRTGQRRGQGRHVCQRVAPALQVVTTPQSRIEHAAATAHERSPSGPCQQVLT